MMSVQSPGKWEGCRDRADKTMLLLKAMHQLTENLFSQPSGVVSGDSTYGGLGVVTKYERENRYLCC